MTGTLVNVAAIVIGSLIGVALKKGIPPHINDAIIKAVGLGTVVIGLNGVLTAMLSADPATGRLSEQGSLLLVISLAVGCLIGELLRIDDRLNNLGRWVEHKMGAAGFAKGFVTGALLFPVGAMAFIGSINDGLFGDASVLYIKSLLDFVMSMVLSSALGIGVLFSAAPVLIVQGSVSLLAGLFAGSLTDPAQAAAFAENPMLVSFCMVGYVLVAAIGLNLSVESKIKVANLLPALPIPILYYLISSQAF